MKGRLFLIFTGLMFFFNPCFNLFDFLPDFIGALLIMWGLGGLLYFDANFESAYNSAKYIFWISLLKLVLCSWCIMGHRAYIMPLTFISAVLEAIFMISLFRSLYLGVDYTLMRSDSKRSPKAANEAFTMSFIFVIVTRFLEFAPQICDILAQDAELDLSHNASFRMPMNQLKIYVMAACLAFGLIIGIAYIVVTVKAWVGLVRDKEYRLFLKEKYDNFLLNERDVYVGRKISLAYFLITIAVAFLVDFYIDAVNLIPTVMTVILLFAASKTMRKLEGKKVNIPLFAASLAASVVSAMYMSKIHLGINYVYSADSFNAREFSLLTSFSSVVYGILFCLVEAVLVAGALNYAISCMKSVFIHEKRKNVLARMTAFRILSSLCVFLMAAARVLTCVCGYFATEPQVNKYVISKAYITSGKIYEEMMANPLISRYEDFVTYQWILTLSSIIVMVLAVVIILNMRHSTEGNTGHNG